MSRTFDQNYLNELGKLRASRRNEIAYMVSCKVPKNEAGLKLDIEEQYFDSLMETAREHEAIYGFWPTFEMEEIESDDPVLDIYGD